MKGSWTPPASARLDIPDVVPRPCACARCGKLYGVAVHRVTSRNPPGWRCMRCNNINTPLPSFPQTIDDMQADMTVVRDYFALWGPDGEPPYDANR